MPLPAVALALAAGLLASLFLLLRHRRARGELQQALDALAQGEWARRLDPQLEARLGPAGRSFNLMGQALERRFGDLAREREELLAILHAMVEGVIAVDAQERLIQLNDSAARMLRADPRASLGRPLWEVTRVSAG